jgi:hypothetical protein
MKIQLKRSNVLEGSGAKEPTAAQMEYGELAVNYNNADPAIFLKNNLGNIIRIAGEDAIGNAPEDIDGYPDLDDGNGATLDDRYVNIVGDGYPDLNDGNGATLDDRYVNITGDTMTGDLTVDASGHFTDLTIGGTLPSAPNIDLNNDGSADFNGDVTFGENPLSASPGHLIRTVGQLITRRDGVIAPVYTVYDGEFFQSNIQIQFQNDGSGHFMGQLGVGGTLPSAPNLQLNSNGTAFFSGQVNVGGTSSSPNLQLQSNGGFISGGNPVSGNNDGVRVAAAGTVSASQTSGTGRLWNGYRTGVGLTSQIRADGNITSLGRLTLGGNYNGSSQENVQITFNGSNGTGTMTGTLTQNTSDIKFKDNIFDAPSQSADIKALKLRTWDWNDSAPGTEARKARHTMGLIAQEAALVDADITYTANEGAEDTDTQFQAIDHDVLTMKLVGALQEALTDIDDLKTRIETLEA